MAASNTDKFKKIARKWVGQVGAGGVATGVASTVPLASSTNLPTDTAVVAVIDRVDINGAKTPSLEETVIGVVSGTDLVSCVRGAEGTAQAHSAGAVVEILITAKGINDLVDGLLVEHNQDGTHKAGGQVVTLDGTQTLTNKTLTSPVVRAFNGWQDANEAWTYASVDGPTGVITVPSDATTKYTPGMRIKLTQSATVKYFIITAVSATSLTVYGGTDYTLANDAISANYYSLMKAPFGFPLDPTKWAVETTDTSSQVQNTPTQNQWYNVGSLNIVIPIGLWNTGYQVVFGGSKSAATAYSVEVTLSTANNSASDADLSTGNYFGGATGTLAMYQPGFKQKTISLASKTTYYLNCRTTVTGGANISVEGGIGKTVIRAVSAYL